MSKSKKSTKKSTPAKDTNLMDFTEAMSFFAKATPRERMALTGLAQEHSKAFSDALLLVMNDFRKVFEKQMDDQIERARKEIKEFIEKEKTKHR